MKFFIDTAEFSEIKDAYSYGFIDGVTTNPSLIVKAKRDLKQVIKEIADLVEGPVSAEVIASLLFTCGVAEGLLCVEFSGRRNIEQRSWDTP